MPLVHHSAKLGRLQPLGAGAHCWAPWNCHTQPPTRTADTNKATATSDSALKRNVGEGLTQHTPSGAPHQTFPRCCSLFAATDLGVPTSFFEKLQSLTFGQRTRNSQFFDPSTQNGFLHGTRTPSPADRRIKPSPVDRARAGIVGCPDPEKSGNIRKFKNGPNPEKSRKIPTPTNAKVGNVQINPEIRKSRYPEIRNPESSGYRIG